MKPGVLLRLMISLICVFIALSLGACRTVGGGVHVEDGTVSSHPPVIHKVEKPIQKVEIKGPPAHAPAHGYRLKHYYRYYPTPDVYFDVQRKVYFYLQGTDWRISASLPGNLHLGSNGFVNIEMDSDKPYTRHAEHRQKYAPVKIKKYEKIKKVKPHLTN